MTPMITKTRLVLVVGSLILVFQDIISTMNVFVEVQGYSNPYRYRQCSLPASGNTNYYNIVKQQRREKVNRKIKQQIHFGSTNNYWRYQSNLFVSIVAKPGSSNNDDGPPIRPVTEQILPINDDNNAASTSTTTDNLVTVQSTTENTALSTTTMNRRVWPCGDELDRRLIALSLPVIANFAIGPLIGAVDLFWVNRMGNALAIAGQAAANQVFNSVFWLTSFLPSVTSTLISKENAQNNTDGVQDAVCQALIVGIFMALISSIAILSNPEQILSSVLPNHAPALQYAKPYLLIRAFAFIPALISLVGFSAFRGILDTLTPVKISLFANVFNAILDPILIFTLSMGVPGAALATLAAEIISAGTFLYLLRKRNMIQFRKIFQIPKWTKLEPLLRGGAALQLRNVALNIAFLAVARVTQSIDKTGVAAAAHAMAIQVFQVGGIVLLALSTVSQIMVPNDLVERYDVTLQKQVGGVQYARATVNRLMSWGIILGIALGSLQLLLLPAIRSSTPIQAVRDAALIPAILASIYQVMNGLVFIGEGVMVGTGSFLQLSINTVIACGGLLWALKVFPPIYGLTGVWFGFGVFNILRLTGVLIHHFMNGSLAPRQTRAKEKK